MVDDGHVSAERSVFFALLRPLGVFLLTTLAASSVELGNLLGCKCHRADDLIIFRGYEVDRRPGFFVCVIAC